MSKFNYYECSARIEFEDGYVFNTGCHFPFDIKPIIEDVIRLEDSLCSNALVKVELSLLDNNDNIVKIMDVTSLYNGGKID